MARSTKSPGTGRKKRLAGQTWRASAGQALVEFALALPLLILIMVAVVDLGRAFYVQTALQNSAREGARYGSVHPTWVTSTDNADPNNIRSRAMTEPAATVAGATVTVTCITSVGVTYDAATNKAGYITCAVSGSRIEVRVTSPFSPATPMISAVLPPAGLTLSGHTRMVIE